MTMLIKVTSSAIFSDDDNLDPQDGHLWDQNYRESTNEDNVN